MWGNDLFRTMGQRRAVVRVSAMCALGVGVLSHTRASATPTMFPPPSVHVALARPLSPDTIPTDPAVTIGTLPNGLRYYIRVNKKPVHHAELRLVVKAGSLMEDDDQRGVAHFVEHMAFRGTTHFRGTEIVEYLKSIGVGFGSDLNATTEFDHTTYILPIPTDTLAQVKEALQIMEDWAHGVAFRTEDLEQERNIILGERRMGLGAGMRVMEQVFPVLYKGALYPDRLPIGTKASIEHATRDQIVRFYQKWYRPDRMAVIAVGDFDKAEMEQLIRAQFSHIPAPTTPLADPAFPVPPQPGTLFAMVRDTELTNTQVMIAYKGAPYARNTVAAERADLIRGMFDEMLDERLAEITEVPNAPFLSGSVVHGEEVLDPATVSIIGVSVVVPDSGIRRGIEGVFAEIARVAQHGFTPAEFDRYKQSTLAQLDHLYRDQNDRFSDAYVGSYIDHFVHGDAIPSIETTVTLSRQLLPTVTLAEIDSEVAPLRSTDNRVIVVMQPKQAKATVPDTTALLALLTATNAKSVASYVDRTPMDALIEHLPVPGHIVAEQQYSTLGITKWTLSNGAIVFLKPTPFKADEILFAGSSPGGTSIFPDTLFPTAAHVTEVVQASRFGRFSPSALAKRLSGKVAGLETSIDDAAEQVSGSAAPHDLETMLQLAYLKMTDAHYDSALVTAFMQQMRVALANMTASPEVVFADTVMVTLSHHSIRAPFPDTTLFDHVNARQAFTLYGDRFADASGFTFVFVGAFHPEQLRPLVERYLASLPTLGRHERAQDRPEFHQPSGVIHKTVVAGQEPKTTTILRFAGPFESTVDRRNALHRLADLLENRLNNSLRERLAGTYSVSVEADQDPAPISEYHLTISFESDPARRTELLTATMAEIDSLKHGWFTAAEVQKTIAPTLRQRQESRQTNEYWLQLVALYQQHRDFNELVDDTPLQSTTTHAIQQAAQQYLNIQHYAEFNLLPAQSTGQASQGTP